MEGHGVTNYDINKPSYSYSTSTTEFDDELIRRGIVTFEQAMLGKGASEEEAHRLSQLKHQQSSTQETIATGQQDNDVNVKEEKEEDEDDFEFEDDDFLRTYREQRLAELKEEHNNRDSLDRALLISRSQWMDQVNKSSYDRWVVVTLICTRDSQRTRNIQELITRLSSKLGRSENKDLMKFVLIPSTDAIPNWPDENLPTIFLYRDGQLQHKWIRIEDEHNPLTINSLQGHLYQLIGENNTGDSFGATGKHSPYNQRSRYYEDDDDEDDDDL